MTQARRHEAICAELHVQLKTCVSTPAPLSLSENAADIVPKLMPNRREWYPVRIAR
jgi:hypothetical protein